MTPALVAYEAAGVRTLAGTGGEATPRVSTFSSTAHDANVDDVDNTAAPAVKTLGLPWSKEEHLFFLKGLQELGKGRWKDIAKRYVVTRSATQVASHAQKHFIRLARQQGSANSRRRSRFSAVESEACAQGLIARDASSVPAVAAAAAAAAVATFKEPALALPPLVSSPASPKLQQQQRRPPSSPPPLPPSSLPSLTLPAAKRQKHSPPSHSIAAGQGGNNSNSALEALLAAVSSASAAATREEEERRQEQDRRREAAERAAAAAERAAAAAEREAQEAASRAAAATAAAAAARAAAALGSSSDDGTSPCSSFLPSLIATLSAAADNTSMASAATKPYVPPSLFVKASREEKPAAVKPVARVPSDVDLAKLAAGLSSAASGSGEDAVVPAGNADSSSSPTAPQHSPSTSSVECRGGGGGDGGGGSDELADGASKKASALRTLSAFVVPCV